MDVILVPGLWLDASSWDAIIPALKEAGHTPHPLTLPGTGEPAAESGEIGIADWVAAVVAAIDDCAAPVVLVGHSGGGNVVWGAADTRPSQVARVIFVDTMPPPDGATISEFDLVDGVVPFPDWDAFDAPDIADLNPETRARMQREAKSVPARVPTDPIHLGDDRRHRIPVTVLSGNADETELREMLTHWGGFAREFAALEHVEVVTLGSGHWPQFSIPVAFSRALADAVTAAD